MSKNTDLGSLVNYIKGQVTGRLNAPAYTSATAFTGTIAGYLGFDTSGNILTSTGSGVGGSGTTNYVPKFTSSSAIGNSLLYSDSVGVGINTTSPNYSLQVNSSTTSNRIQLTNTSSGTAGADGLQIGQSGLDAYISNREAGAFDIETSGVARLSIASTGAATFSSSVTAGSSGQVFLTGNAGTASIGMRFTNTGGNSFIGLSNSGGTGYLSGSAYAFNIQTEGAQDLQFGTNNANRLIIHSTTGKATFSSSVQCSGAFIQANQTEFFPSAGASNRAFAVQLSNTVAGDFGIATGSTATGGTYTTRLYITTDGGININTTATGYTLNAIRSTSTQFNAAYKASGSLVQIMARFMGDTSSNLGIAIGYASATYGSTSGIWATQAGILFLGVLDGTTYKSKIRIDTTTVAIDIPTSSSGLASGQLWNDGGTVKITT